MSMTDTLGDMLTRIRNGQMARLVTVSSPSSKLRVGVLEVLKREGYIAGFNEESEDDSGNSSSFKKLSIELKYVEGQSVIREIKKISKPGRRVYSSIEDLKKYYNGLGIAILSTSKGIMSDYEARLQNVGGEILCSVF